MYKQMPRDLIAKSYERKYSATIFYVQSFMKYNKLYFVTSTCKEDRIHENIFHFLVFLKFFINHITKACMFICLKYQGKMIIYHNTVMVRVLPRMRKVGSQISNYNYHKNITNVNALDVSNPIELPVLIG